MGTDPFLQLLKVLQPLVDIAHAHEDRLEKSGFWEAWGNPKFLKLEDCFAARDVLVSLEWSGTVYGQGDGPHGSGRGSPFAACPACRGLKSGNIGFIASAVGHQPGCKLAGMLRKPTRQLAKNEQGVLSI